MRDRKIYTIHRVLVERRLVYQMGWFHSYLSDLEELNTGDIHSLSIDDTENMLSKINMIIRSWCNILVSFKEYKENIETSGTITDLFENTLRSNNFIGNKIWNNFKDNPELAVLQWEDDIKSQIQLFISIFEIDTKYYNKDLGEIQLFLKDYIEEKPLDDLNDADLISLFEIWLDKQRIHLENTLSLCTKMY